MAIFNLNYEGNNSIVIDDVSGKFVANIADQYYTFLPTGSSSIITGLLEQLGGDNDHYFYPLGNSISGIVKKTVSGSGSSGWTYEGNFPVVQQHDPIISTVKYPLTYNQSRNELSFYDNNVLKFKYDGFYNNPGSGYFNFYWQDGTVKAGNVKLIVGDGTSTGSILYMQGGRGTSLGTILLGNDEDFLNADAILTHTLTYAYPISLTGDSLPDPTPVSGFYNLTPNINGYYEGIVDNNANLKVYYDNMPIGQAYTWILTTTNGIVTNGTYSSSVINGVNTYTFDNGSILNANNGQINWQSNIQPTPTPSTDIDLNSGFFETDLQTNITKYFAESFKLKASDFELIDGVVQINPDVLASITVDLTNIVNTSVTTQNLTAENASLGVATADSLNTAGLTATTSSLGEATANSMTASDITATNSTLGDAKADTIELKNDGLIIEDAEGHKHKFGFTPN